MKSLLTVLLFFLMAAPAPGQYRPLPAPGVPYTITPPAVPPPVMRLQIPNHGQGYFLYYGSGVYRPYRTYCPRPGYYQHPWRGYGPYH
jgi:hypothetical protein